MCQAHIQKQKIRSKRKLIALNLISLLFIAQILHVRSSRSY